MNLTVVTPPALEPVTLEAALAQLHEPLEQDARISGLVTAAREWAEHYTNRAFIEQTLRVSGEAFRAGYYTYYPQEGIYNYGKGILLPRQPLIAIESVKYYDADNAQQTVDEADYYTTADGRVRFVDGYSYPSFYCRSDAMQVEYTAGYGTTAASVPQSIKQAILLGVELDFAPLTPDERVAMENSRKALLDPYRVFEYASV